MIELIGINKTFYLGGQPIHALRDINLVVDTGEYVSVMGPSGSGKSTLLNMIGLLDEPDNGTYRINQQNALGLSDAQRAQLRLENMGFVFQSYHLISRLSAQENIELPLTLAGVPPKERHLKSTDIMQRLNLVDRAQHKPAELSGGQRQRVAIARALIMQPEILLADEPTGNLDTASGAEVTELLEGLNEQGITLLVVTHDQHLGNRATRQIKMVDGAIVKDLAKGLEKDSGKSV